MKSTTATLALLLWPLVAVALFAALPKVQATLWTIIGGQLLLPVGEAIKIEMIPPFDKASVPSLCIFMVFVFSRRQPRKLGIGLPEFLIATFLLGPIATSLLNNDVIFAGDRVIPGVGLYDAGSAIGAAFIALMPFFVGRTLLRGSYANEQILKALTLAGLFYSIPMLFEMWFSPQLHAWIYGYYPTDFIQQVRGDGYRPMVFMGHGLIAATFMFMTVCAAAALWRTKTRIASYSAGWAVSYLSVVLGLCRSAGAAIFGVAVVPLICFARPRAQSMAATMLVLAALLYPMLRFSGLVPTSQILESVESFSKQRADSLRVRFENEAMLVGHAFERPVFGWGRYGRSRVYSDEGRDVSVTDGRWVITIGQFGIVGFIAEFGLLALAVIKAAAAYRLAGSYKERIFLTALALLVAANVVDLLPNSSLLPMTWLFAGALLGRSEALREVPLRSPEAAISPQNYGKAARAMP